MNKYIVSDEFGTHYFADHLTIHMIESFTDGDLHIINFFDKTYLSDAGWNDNEELLHNLTWSPVLPFQNYELD